MSQIPSEYVIPEGIHNPNSQDISEGLTVIASELSDNTAFESQIKEFNISSARREMGGTAIFGPQPEQITNPVIERVIYIAKDLRQAREEYLRAA